MVWANREKITNYTPLFVPTQCRRNDKPHLFVGETPMRILLADDKPQVRSALRLLLEQELSLQIVGEAINTNSLLEMTRSTQPDLVLLDWELPGLSTSNLLPRLRQYSPQSQVVVLSSHPEAREAAMVAGSDAFISKGSPPERLLTMLNRLQQQNTTGG